MTPEHFRIALRSFAKQRAFKPYTIEFSSGATIAVDHPEAVRFHESMLVYRSTQGIYVLFDSGEVTRFIGARVST